MSLLPLCEKPLIFESNESVSKVSSSMSDKRKHEVIILDDNEYKGIVFAKDLVKRKINNPKNTEIGKFVTNITPIPSETSIEDAVNSMLINDYRSLPIAKDGEYYILTKIGILKNLKNSSSFKVKINEIMKFPFCVSSYDSISTTMSVLRETEVSRLPVLNKESKTEGLVDSIDLLKANFGLESSKKGERIGEKIKKREADISSIMYKNNIILTPRDSVKNAVEMMIRKNNPTILIEEKNKLVGIVTPKMILKLLGSEISGILVTISGIKDEDAFIKSVVDEEIANAVRKLNKIIKIEHLILHVDKYHEKGNRKKYSVKSRMMTEKGMLFSSDFAWDITKAVRGVLQKLEKEIIKKKEKSVQ